MFARISITVSLTLALGGFISGCQIVHPAQGLLEQQDSSANMSSRELRSILDDFISQYSDDTEEAADRILAKETDITIRTNALLWKTNGISACFQAAARSDPLGAFLDVWILNKQTTALFENPSQQQLFGRWQELAIETSRRLENRLLNIHAEIGMDVPIGETFVVSFSRDYPVHSLYFARESVAARYTEYLERIKVADRELLEVVGGLEDRLDQLHKLSALYAEFLPKQARWQSELLLMEAIPTSLFADLSLAADSMDRIARVGEQVPSMVQRERNSLEQLIAAERVATLEAVEEMRTVTMTQLGEERAAVLDALRDERQAVTDELTAQAERMFSNAGPAIRRELNGLTKRTEKLTDHAFQRAAQLGLACMIFLCGVLLVLIRFQSRRGNLLDGYERPDRDTLATSPPPPSRRAA